MFEDAPLDMPSSEGMTEIAQQRAAAAFHSWLWDGLLARGIDNVQALAQEFDVAPKVVVNLWYDNKTVAFLGSRLAHCLRSYLDEFGLHFVATAGNLGDKATLAEPSLSELIDDVVSEWDAMADHGCLEPLSPDALRRLLVLAIQGAFSRVSLRVLCDSVPDDEPVACDVRARGH